MFTVSDNQRHLISERLGIPLDKIGVTYNGWEHLQNVQPDITVFDKLPGVKKKSIITHWEAWPGTKTLSGCARLPPATRIKPLLWPAARTLLPLAAPKQMLPKTPAISFTPAM